MSIKNKKNKKRPGVFTCTKSDTSITKKAKIDFIVSFTQNNQTQINNSKRLSFKPRKNKPIITYFVNGNVINDVISIEKILL